MEILSDIPLKPFNTFGIEAQAGEFAVLDDEKDIGFLVDYHRGGMKKMLLLGGGSNVLFSGDYHGLVVKINTKGTVVTDEDDESVTIRAAAGEVWDDFVEYTVSMGWGGLENLSGIPGLAGSSPIQNIGAYGSEMKDHFVSLEAVDLCTGEMTEFDKERCRFGYRDSIFKRALKDRMIIKGVTFRLSKKPACNLSYHALKQMLAGYPTNELTPALIRNAVMEIRRSKLPDPAIAGNAGSFFKNPVVTKLQLEQLKEKFPGIVHFQTSEPENDTTDGQFSTVRFKLAAGWLIEQCGWRGFREGDAGVHKDQALVLVNFGKATGIDILKLAEKIKNSVKDKFGIKLESEVNII